MNFKRDGVVVQRQFIAGDAFLAATGFGGSGGVAFQPRKIRLSHDHAAELVLAAEKLQQAEFIPCSCSASRIRRGSMPTRFWPFHSPWSLRSPGEVFLNQLGSCR